MRSPVQEEWRTSLSWTWRNIRAGRRAWPRPEWTWALSTSGKSENSNLSHSWGCSTIWCVCVQDSIFVHLCVPGLWWLCLLCARVIEPAMLTAIRWCGTNPGTRATWRSRPRRRGSHWTSRPTPPVSISVSFSSGSRGRKRAGSTRLTATPRSTWRMETVLRRTAASGPWCVCVWVGQLVGQFQGFAFQSMWVDE